MFNLKQSTRSTHESHIDTVMLADGTFYRVERANLAAAKGLLAAQRAAERRVAERIALTEDFDGRRVYERAS